MDRLLSLLPPDQSAKLSTLLKSDDPMNQNMGLELIDSLAMFSDNEEAITLLGNALRRYMEWFEIMDSGIDKPDSPIQYPELEAKWPKIKSALLQYALKAVKDNFNMLKDNAVNYAS
ncbi:MAG: hypothetical protein EBS77_09865, partial [Gammaproteobacteria bacterium]|nr:hypothetical protein [Gammaproteobacteria bacterium]